jgi:hypothetical protein
MEGVASSRLALSPPLGSSFLLSGFLYISIRRGWVSLPVLVTPHDTLNMLHVGFKLSIDLPSDQSIIWEQNRTFAHSCRRDAKLLSHENVLNRRPSAWSDHLLGWYIIFAKLVFVVLYYSAITDLKIFVRTFRAVPFCPS